MGTWVLKQKIYYSHKCMFNNSDHKNTKTAKIKKKYNYDYK